MCVLLLQLSACGPDPRARVKAQDLPENMREAFYEFYRQADFKAFAVSGRDIENDFWVYGSAFGARSQASADNWAIKRCEYMRRKYNVDQMCRIFARGD